MQIIENDILLSHEKNYPPVEQCLIAATRFLAGRDSDGAAILNGIGFNKIDTGFGRSLVDQLDAGKRWTPNQLNAIAKILPRYKVQLLSGGIILPNPQEVALLLKDRETTYQAGPQKLSLPNHPKIDMRNDETGNVCFFYYVPYAKKDMSDAFKEELSNRYKKGEEGFTGWAIWTKNEAKEWKCPASEQILLLFLSNKYFPNAELTPAAYKIKQAQEERVASEMRVREVEDKKRKLIYAQILKTVGLHGSDNPEVAPGIHLMKHQREAVRFIVWKRRCLIADQVGLGKTFEAIVAGKAFFLYYGWKIVVVTTKSMTIQWGRDCAKFGINAEIYTWDKIPVTDETWGNFIFIADESQFGKNEGIKRTENMKTLALDEKCQVFVPMTGTPLDNSRPREAYPALLSIKNPHVWDENPAKIREKKRWYEKTFCGAHIEVYGGRRVMDEDGNIQVIGGKKVRKTDGGTNLKLWHKLFVYHYGAKDNDAHSCILARRKKDIPAGEMPSCTIYPREADINVQEVKRFEQQIQEAIARFEETVKTGRIEFIENFKIEKGINPSPEEIQEKVDQITSAKNMVMFQAYARAGAYAKIPWILGEVDELLEDGDKVVLGTTFKDVAYELQSKIDQKYGKGTCLTIEGTVSDKKRDTYIQDFQDPSGKSKVFIITKAGGIGITLTAACTFFSLERAIWTPGTLEQQYGRVNRKGQTRPVSVILAQMPEYVTDVDQRIDAIIETKAVGSNTALYDENHGIVYNIDINKAVEGFVSQIIKDFKKSKTTAEK